MPVDCYDKEIFLKQTKKRKPLDTEVEIYVSLYQKRIKINDYSNIINNVIKMITGSFIKSKKQIFKIDIERWKSKTERMEIEIIET